MDRLGDDKVGLGADKLLISPGGERATNRIPRCPYIHTHTPSTGHTHTHTHTYSHTHTLTASHGAPIYSRCVKLWIDCGELPHRVHVPPKINTLSESMFSHIHGSTMSWYRFRLWYHTDLGMRVRITRPVFTRRWMPGLIVKPVLC